MIQFSFTQIAHFYVATLICFSVCLIFVAGRLNFRPALFWVFSNISSSFATELFLVGEITYNNMELRPLIFILQSLAPLLKFIALAHGWKYKKFRWIVSGLITVSLILPLAAYELSPPGFELLFLNIGTLFLPLACIFAVASNRYWRGYIGRATMMINFAFAGMAVFWKTLRSWEQGSLFFLFGTKEDVIFVLILLGVVGTVGQMAFLLMLTSRTRYYANIKHRREERIRARSISLRWQNKEISRLLDEQRRLLETLTHEVRQPINNAQAALQGIMSELQPTRGTKQRALNAAVRIQGILDDITLSLSNAIIGATLVERGESPNLRDCEITGIAQLALLDCPASARERIVIDFPANDIFLAVDPILLRLALRNLLDNAAKFSPPETDIIFSIALDEERFGVLIAVNNCVEASFAFERDMVSRGNRGLNAGSKEGSGIGLYVVNEVARIHGNAMVIETSEPGKVTFGILLSE